MGKRLIQQRRGRTKGRFQAPSHNFRGKIKYIQDKSKHIGIVEDIIHDPGHTAPLAIIRLDNNKKTLVLAPEGIEVGNKIKFTDSRREAKVGNVLSIGKISEGMPIYNVELSPGDGGKLVRAAGNNATIVSHS